MFVLLFTVLLWLYVLCLIYYVAYIFDFLIRMFYHVAHIFHYVLCTFHNMMQGNCYAVAPHTT